MKNFGFVTLNDGSCFKDLQVVVNRENARRRRLRRRHRAVNVGAALSCRGRARAHARRVRSRLSCRPKSYVVEGASAPDYPMQKKRQTREFLRTQQHLRRRTNLFRAVFRVRSVAAFAIHQFFQERGFVYVNTPIITASDCRGRRRDVPRDHARPGQPAQDQGRAHRLQPGLLWQARQPHRLRPAPGRELCPLLWRRLHLRSHLPRRELQHARVTPRSSGWSSPRLPSADLEDDMDLRRETCSSTSSTTSWTIAPTEMEFFNKFVDKGLIERLKHVVELRLRARDLHRGRQDSRGGPSSGQGV